MIGEPNSQEFRVAQWCMGSRAVSKHERMGPMAIRCKIGWQKDMPHTTPHRQRGIPDPGV